MLKSLFKFESYLIHNGIAQEKDILYDSIDNRKKRLITLSNFLKTIFHNKPPLKSASHIYSQYIRNDDTQIRKLLRSMLPIYSRNIRLIKLKYFYHWKTISKGMKLCYSSSFILQKRHSNDSKLSANNSYCIIGKEKTIQGEAKCSFSPKINSYYPVNYYSYPLKVYRTIEEEKTFKRNRRCHQSMQSIFPKVDLSECCKVTFPEYTYVRPFYSYRDIIQSEPLKRQIETIEISTRSKAKTNHKHSKLSYNRIPIKCVYTPSYSPKSFSTISSKSNLNKNSLKSIIKDAKKAGQSINSKYRNLTMNSKELSFPPSNNPHMRQVSLQTLSDSKLLQLATHYITTDESLEKFQLNIPK